MSGSDIPPKPVSNINSANPGTAKPRPAAEPALAPVPTPAQPDGIKGIIRWFLKPFVQFKELADPPSTAGKTEPITKVPPAATPATSGNVTAPGAHVNFPSSTPRKSFQVPLAERSKTGANPLHAPLATPPGASPVENDHEDPEPGKPLPPFPFDEAPLHNVNPAPTAATASPRATIVSAPSRDGNVHSVPTQIIDGVEYGPDGPIIHKAGYTKPPVVTFKNVGKTFNPGTKQEYCAIKDINFTIDDLPDVGEFISLIGPSGCGKSTVLNLIEGFPEVWPPTTGEVLIRNLPVTGPGKDRGMIFQKYSSFPNKTVLENVLFGLQINDFPKALTKADMKKLAMDMIIKVGLLGHENKYPCQLSGGQQQRVAIARTLVLKPRIILMDEPFSALDEPTRIDMQGLITELWTEVEATVFIVTHSIAEAVYLSDRIFLFTPGPGRIVDKIMVRPEHIGKEPGKSPLDIQESQKFKEFLKMVTSKFLDAEKDPKH